MIMHWLTAGWRSLIANPLFTLITVASLSIGCCGALLAAANIRHHLSYERWVPDAERIFLVRQHRERGGPGPPAQAADAFAPAGALPPAEDLLVLAMRNGLENRLPGIESQVRLIGGGEPPEDEDRPPLMPNAVDPEFFDMFGVEFVEGDASKFTTLDTVILTESQARKRFGDGPWVGKIFEEEMFTNRPVTVIGVVRDLPTATHHVVDAFVSIDTFLAQVMSNGSPGAPAPDFSNNWGFFFGGGRHFIKIKEGVDPKVFAATAGDEIEKIVKERAKTGPMANARFTVVPLLDLHLAGKERTAMDSSSELAMLITLGSAAAALLFVSGFNYVTLSLARSLKRRREVAVRKALGAQQGNLVSQYLAESALVTAISLLAGVGLAYFLSPWFARVIGQPNALLNIGDPVILVAMAIGGVALAFAVGAYPAFYLAHVRPRVGLDTGAAAALGPIGRLVSQILLAVQIAAATILLTIALTMGAQSNYIATRPMGFTMKDMHTVPSPCIVPPAPLTPEQRVALRACDTRFLDLVRKAPGVLQASRASTFALFQPNAPAQPFSRPGVTGEAGRAMRVAVETDFMQMMGATLLAGRFYDSSSAYDRQFLDRKMLLGDHTSDRAPIIVSRAFLPLINVTTPEEAIGKTITMPQGAARIGAFEIVGVVEDWNRRSLRQSVDPIIFTPGGITMQMVARIDPDVWEDEGLPWLTSMWRAQGGADGGNPDFILTVPFQQTFENSYRDDQRLMIAVAGFASLSILVACVGVYGLTAFDMRRRVREIGIRKALGATPRKVAGMVVSRQIVFAAIASALSWPVGFWLANEWLLGFVYRTQLGAAVLPVASAFIIGFVAFAVSLTAIPAVAIRPSTALRLGT
jgi:putative ABC transport system permease protein